MSNEIRQMMGKSGASKIVKKYAEDSFNYLDQSLDHAHLCKDDNH